MFCPNCGQKFEGTFCPACGTKVEAPATQPAVQLNSNPIGAVAQQAQSKLKGKFNKKIGIIAGVVAAVVLFLILSIHECEWCGESFMFGGEKIEIMDESGWICDDCTSDPFGSWF